MNHSENQKLGKNIQTAGYNGSLASNVKSSSCEFGIYSVILGKQYGLSGFQESGTE